jgi:outer membrane usher protein
LLPVGARGRVEGGRGAFVIGYDGKAYLKDLTASNVAIVDVADGQCRATFSYVRTGEQTVIDPVICR